MNQNPSENCQLSSRIRSLENAKNWAENSLVLLGPTTKSSSPKRIIESCDIIINPKTKASGADVDTLMYVFNFADSTGFSIIDADSGFEPIIAVTESGHYSPGTPTGVDGFDLYIEGLTERLSFRSGPIQHHWYEYVTVGDSVNHSVGLKWGQNGIYGKYCPNLTSGCVPTAIAQILAYHEYPSSFIVSVDMGSDFANGDIVPLNWEGIKSHIISHTDSLPCNAHHNNIGALLREIGYIAGTTYNTNPNTSSTFTSAVPGTFGHFGFNTSEVVSITSTNIPSLLECIRVYGPVYMDGERIDENTLRGHAWVADGYKDYAYYRDKYSYDVLGFEPGLVERILIRESHVLHINWGWNGYCNGYFNFNNYDVDNAVIYDDLHYTTGRNYNIDINMVVIYPINPYLI